MGAHSEVKNRMTIQLSHCTSGYVARRTEGARASCTSLFTAKDPKQPIPPLVVYVVHPSYGILIRLKTENSFTGTITRQWNDTKVQNLEHNLNNSKR